ncbi:putative quinol monooxygenase [Mycolicibacterium baixiangningiae]|uniref:putative quinol monooxygenase n=1 Tax=Mycolicibacterium baixiangningiae TaxID=2761578 RepID=UPI0018D04DE7|nr:antibiotic biosynthesis monooxygenase [Mycolicibacterium baixiangningiae]
MTPSAEGAIGPADGDLHPDRRPDHAGPGSGPVCLVTQFAAVDDSAARRLQNELQALAASVVTEPGHLSYEVFADQDDPKNLYVIETWASASSARRHEDLVLNNGTVERVAPLLTGALQTLTLRPVATANPTREPASDTGHAGFNDKEAEYK